MSATETYLLNSTQLDHYRAKIDECLDVEPELWQRRFENKDEVWHNIYSGFIQMWAICDADCIHGVFMTEIVWKPQNVLRVFWCYGKGIIAVLPCVDLVLDRFAKQMGCTEIQLEGRRGWERVFRNTGAEFMCSTFRRPVRILKEN